MKRKLLRQEKTTFSVLPPEHFTANDIREIRRQTGLTQVLFAEYMGVSVKTVEAWESGRNHPDGPACRLLTITKQNPAFPKSSRIISFN